MEKFLIVFIIAVGIVVLISTIADFVRMLSNRGVNAELAELQEMYGDYLEMYELKDTRENWNEFLKIIIKNGYGTGD